jgi:signal transduction histidine kinase
VSDTGEGIAAERLEQIFKPFVRVSGAGPGLGIGLALVRRIAQMHSGRVNVESNGPGCGTLPVGPAPRRRRSSFSRYLNRRQRAG